MAQYIVPLLSFAGTLIGTLGGILVSNKLTNYRIQQLEIRVDKHNTLIERMYRVEGQVKELEHDVADIKKGR